MPGYDGTGPNGQGPLTGRGLGSCENDQIAEGYGRGFARGRGYGFRGRFAQPKIFQNSRPLTEEEERVLLKRELNLLNEDKERIEKRLEEIKE
ncbi:DUF5320 domain-containing protein [Patescibacteria group bacterium]|nr:DUF5320 domain-containing protein [Patescibacteria group bacterium]